MKLSIAFGLCAAWAPLANAAGDWLGGQVVTDGAAVYSKPDFDSPVQDYLGFQSKVVISRRPQAGQGGMGLFHRVRYNGKVGYIPDTDVRASSKELEKSGEDPGKKRVTSKALERADKKEKREHKPLYFTRFLGLNVADVDFTEKFSGHKLSSNMLMYGLRMMGPGTLFDGPPLDLNVWVSFQKPSYYTKFAQPPSGFLAFGDLAVVLPLMNANNTLLSYSLGLMWTYTRYVVPVKSGTTGVVANFDSQEIRAGGALGIGLGHRFNKTEVRADAKYYIEKTSYPGFGAALLFEF